MYSRLERIRRLQELTSTEREALYYICQGMDDGTIGQLADITIKAVQARKIGIYEKLGLKNVSDNEKRDRVSAEYCPLVSELVPTPNDLKIWPQIMAEAYERELGEDKKREEDANRREEEELARKKQEEELALKKREEEELARQKQEEEELARKKREQEEAKAQEEVARQQSD